MPTLDIGGKTVTVGDDFLRLSPDEQNATVEEIAASLGAKPEAAPFTAEGAYKALDIGAQEGVAGLAALPRQIGTLGAQGIQSAANWAARKLGLPEDTRDLEKQKGLVELPTYESALKTIQTDFGGQPYTPQNTAEEYIRTGGQMLPNLIGGGGIVRSVVAPAVASETAGQLTKGYGAEPYARMLGAVGGAALGATTGNILRTARGYRGAPTLPDVSKAVDEGYTAARTAGVELNPTYVSSGLSDIMRGLVTGPDARSPRNISQTLALLNDEAKALAPAAAPKPGAMAAITKVAPAAPAAKQAVDFTKLDGLRRDLGDLAADFTKPTERVAARIAQNKIDDLLEAAGKTPGAVLKGDADLLAQTAREARGNAAARFRMQVIEAAKERAAGQAGGAHSGLNFENAYRQQLNQLTRPSQRGKPSVAQQEGMTPYEISEIRRANRGMGLPNLLRYAGNLAGGGGGLGTLGGGGAGYLVGGPFGAMAVPAAGLGSRLLSNTMMGSRANYLNRMIAARSPLAQQMGFRQPGAPISMAPPSLLSLYPAYQGGGQ